jgi:REase_DpnII-MboI
MKDEYDVQDSLHALLKLHFDDVRREEWTPSYAGSQSRMDFLLKREKIVVETKFR